MYAWTSFWRENRCLKLKESSKPLWRIRKIPAIQNAESNLSLRRQKLPVSILSVRLLGLKRKKLGFIGRIRGDLPPRTGFAEKWHPQLLQELPDIQLTLLIGQYAQAYYLHEKVSGKVTERVKHYKDYLPEFFPLVHPSPRNQIWMAKNPWFESEVVPDLKKRIQKILGETK